MSVLNVTEYIRVDAELLIKLLYKFSPLPVSQWFYSDQNCCLKRKSMLGNVPVYLPLQTEKFIFG